MTITGGRPHCPRCGAVLHKGQPSGAKCLPCLQRAEPDSRYLLPDEFLATDRVQAALAEYDFGTFLRLARAEQDWSQQLLGEVLDLTQSRISALERGLHQLRDVEVVARLSCRLGVPAPLLGFSDRRVTLSGRTPGRKGVSWVDRRDFVDHVLKLSLAFGGLGASGVDIDRLISLLPHAEPTGARHVGVADVEAIEQATARFMQQDFAQGAGLTRDAAVSQVRAVLPLLNAQVSDELRPKLMMATARLAMQAGWMSFGSCHHDAARRLWLIALDLARHSNHRQAGDLTVFLLQNMGQQAVHLDRPQEALHLVRVGQTAAVGSHPVSASTACCLASTQARAEALAGDTTACDRALGHAEERFTDINLATSPPYSAHRNEIGLAVIQGRCHYMLAQPGRNPRTAQKAVPLLRRAVEGFGPGYRGVQALYLPDLAGAHAISGDTDTAVALGHQAIEAVTAVHSARAHDQLRVLNTVLEPLHANPDVAELRDRLTTIAAA